jgi:hypothetical protein
MRDKPVLGSVAWSHTIFRIFRICFPNASCSKLRVSTNFMILGATDQKLWVSEVFRRSLGRADMCLSQWGVDHMRKKMEVGGKKMGVGGRKMGDSCITKGACVAASEQSLVTGQQSTAWGWPATSDRPPTTMWVPCSVRSSKFFYFKFLFFWDFCGISWHFGRMGVQHPHFLKLASTVGSVKSSEIGDFTFFQILFFLN